MDHEDGKFILSSLKYTVLLVGLRRFRLWGLMGSDGMTCRRRRSRDSSNVSAAGNESLTSMLSWMLCWRECDWEESMTAVVGRLRLPGTGCGDTHISRKIEEAQEIEMRSYPFASSRVCLQPPLFET